jgi:hypothetical protein
MMISTPRMIELAVAVVLLGIGIVLYRRPKTDDADKYGSQGAVILFVVAAIMGIHALGGLDYHPSAAEAEYIKEHAR